MIELIPGHDVPLRQPFRKNPTRFPLKLWNYIKWYLIHRLIEHIITAIVFNMYFCNVCIYIYIFAHNGT